jgi:hypothetical protein
VSRPPTIDQLRNIAGRAYNGPLQPAEIARLLEGIEHLAAKPPQRRRQGPPLTAARRLQRIRERLHMIHAPLLRGGVEVCRECSGWDGVRCRGLVTPYPCPTVEAMERPRAGLSGPQSAREPAGGAPDIRDAPGPPDGHVAARGEAAA